MRSIPRRLPLPDRWCRWTISASRRRVAIPSWRQSPDQSVAAPAAVYGSATRAFSTTAPDLGPSISVDTGSGNMLIQMFGLIEDKDGTVWYFENFTGGLY